MKDSQELGNQPPLECYNIVKTYDILYFTFLTPYRIQYKNKKFELRWSGICSKVLRCGVYLTK